MFDNLDYLESKTKEHKRVEILQVAMGLFIRDGIHNVTMQKIAKKSKISIRSLYYYYSNKEDLAVDIQISLFGSDWLKLDDEDTSELTAYELLYKLKDNLVSYINNNPKVVKYIAAFDFYFYNSYPSDKYLIHLEKIQSSELSSKIIRKAKLDNSIDDKGYGTLTTISTLFHSIMAYSQRIIYREKAMLLEKAGDKGSLELHAQLLMESLKKDTLW